MNSELRDKLDTLAGEVKDHIDSRDCVSGNITKDVTRTIDNCVSVLARFMAVTLTNSGLDADEIIEYALDGVWIYERR